MRFIVAYYSLPATHDLSLGIITRRWHEPVQRLFDAASQSKDGQIHCDQKATQHNGQEHHDHRF